MHATPASTQSAPGERRHAKGLHWPTLGLAPWLHVFTPSETPPANRSLGSIWILQVREPEQVAPWLDQHGVERLDVVLWEGIENLGLLAVRMGFAVLEALAQDKRLSLYGVHSETGFRVPEGDPRHLQLNKLVHEAGVAAMGVGAERADAHRFQVLSTVVNLAMLEAYHAPNQPFKFGKWATIPAASEMGMVVLARNATARTTIGDAVDSSWLDLLDVPDGSAAAIQAMRSMPGVSSVVVESYESKAAADLWNRPSSVGIVRTLLGEGGPHG